MALVFLQDLRSQPFVQNVTVNRALSHRASQSAQQLREESNRTSASPPATYKDARLKLGRMQKSLLGPWDTDTQTGPMSWSLGPRSGSVGPTWTQRAEVVDHLVPKWSPDQDGL